MDVLLVIKEEHNALRGRLEALLSSKTLKERKAVFGALELELLRHIHLETEFVYPEAEEVDLNVTDSFFNISLENHKLIKRSLTAGRKAIEKGAEACKKSKSFSALQTAVENHFELEEAVLMPKLRKGLATQEREDLGMVYRDLVMEYPVVTSSKKASKPRKRA